MFNHKTGASLYSSSDYCELTTGRNLSKVKSQDGTFGDPDQVISQDVADVLKQRKRKSLASSARYVQNEKRLQEDMELLEIAIHERAKYKAEERDIEEVERRAH